MSGLSTAAVHAGERPDPSGAINTPIVASSTYRYPELEDGTPAPYIYSRYENPTVEALEAKHAALEGSKHALAFASGMAAIACVCQTLQPGDTIAVMEGIYGGTMAYLERELAPKGINVFVFDAFGDEVPPAQMIWLESITNPLLRVPDVPRWAAAAKETGATLVVDATFATPILHRPLDEGADFVVHSATKYLGGHSDVTGGILAFNGDRQGPWETRRNWGATMDPQAAYLIMRGMKTLPLRVHAQVERASALAAVLARRGVTVHYPGLADHADHDRGALLDGPGAVLTLDLGSQERAVAFRRAVKVITPAASLGGVESLLSLPLETSHAYMESNARHALGITDGLVRISIGIEDLDDLRDDIEQALDAIA